MQPLPTLKYPPNKQFPVRLSDALDARFTRVSNESHISKSKLVRLALNRFLSDIDNSGITAALSFICTSENQL